MSSASIASTAFVWGFLFFFIIHSRTLQIRTFVLFALNEFTIKGMTTCVSNLPLRTLFSWKRHFGFLFLVSFELVIQSAMTNLAQMVRPNFA